MSFSVNVHGQRDDVASELRRQFEENYPEPAEGVADIFDIGVACVEEFMSRSDDPGNFQIMVAGHAKQEKTERDNLTVAIGVAP